MKMFSRSLLLLFSFVAVISLPGCEGEEKATSMTEGVELSEIEAYEKAVREMEEEDSGAMEKTK